MQWMFWVLAFFVSLGAGYMVYRSDVKRGAPYPRVTAALRTVVWLLVFLLLLAPSVVVTKHETEKPVIVFLQDNSLSVANGLKGDTASYRRHAAELISRLEEQYRVDNWGFGGDVRMTDSLFTYTQPATDIAAALEKIHDIYTEQNLGAVILASDGRFNQGSNPLFHQPAISAPVYTVGLGDTAVQRDIRIARVYANEKVPRNSRFEVRTDIIAQLCKGFRGHLRLSKDGQVIAASDIMIGSDRYDASLSFQVTAETPGVHHYVLQVSPAEGEEHLTNNRKDFFVEVIDDKKKVLIAAAAPHPDIRAIRDALAGTENYTITVRTTGDLPQDIEAYDAVVLHNIPVAATQQAALKTMPVWFIAGAGMHIPVLNQLQNAAVFAPGAGMRDVRPEYNPSFYQFILPSDIRAVTDKMPPLHVSAGPIQLSPDAEALFVQQHRSGAVEPLWWLRQGSRPVALLAGTGLWRWRMYEYRHFKQHAVVDECIRQTVSFLTANTKEKPFRATLPKHVWSDQEPVILQAYLLNANNEQINTPEAELVVTDSAGRQQTYSFERAGSTYRLHAGIMPPGSYVYTAGTVYRDQRYTDKGHFVVTGTPPELMETGADYSLLYGLAQHYNGSFVAWQQTDALYDSITRHAQIKPVIRTVTESLPLIDRKWYFFLLLLVAAGEWLLRKYWMAQ